MFLNSIFMQHGSLFHRGFLRGQQSGQRFCPQGAGGNVDWKVLENASKPDN